MNSRTLYASLKIAGYAVMAMLGVSMLYAGYMGIAYWTGIGV